jgi:hypothetical protein
MTLVGSAAIDVHVDAADGAPATHRWTPHSAGRSSGPSPLAEITAHRLEAPPHWHIVTYGLSDLSDLEGPEAPVAAPAEREGSGWGFELTVRLEDPVPVAEGEEPQWAVDFLTNLAAYVNSSGHAFAEGHHIDLRGPMRLGTDTRLTAAVVVMDPALGLLDGPLGTVEFLQVVGITADELELCRSWSTEGVVELLARQNPLLVTLLGRDSLLADPDVASEVAERVAGEGSSLTELLVGTLHWSTRRQRRAAAGKAVVELGSGASAALGPALRRELVGAGASFTVMSDEQELRFVVSEPPGWTAHDHTLEVRVPLDEVAGLSALFDGRTGSGRRELLPGLRFRVVR